VSSNALGQAAVNTPRRGEPSRRVSDRQSRAALQKRDNVRSSDGRKPGEEIVDCVSRLKVIQQRLDGHARTGEHRRSPQYLRRAADDGRAHAHTLPAPTPLDKIGGSNEAPNRPSDGFLR